MQSRSDQLQAHLFTVSRLVSGLTHGEPDAPETPAKRFTSGLVGSVFVGLLAVAAVAVIGLLAGGASAAFRAPGTIIVEKETAGRFLLLRGELRPLLNYTSALLITGSSKPPVVSVSAAALRGIRHGPPVGIPDAPEALPPATGLTTGAWSVCSAAAPGGPVRVDVGSARGVVPLDARHGLLVRTPDDATYLVWRDRRFRIGAAAALTALGYQSVPPLPVGAAWTAALPTGPALAARAIAGRGRPGPDVGGQAHRIGQVFEEQGLSGGQQFSVLLAGGLSPLSRTEAALLLGDPATQAAYRGQRVAAISISAAALAGAPRAASSVTAGLPPAPPQLVTAAAASADAAPCYTVTPGHAGPTIQVGLGRVVPPGNGVWVVVPPDGGLLATPVSLSGQRGPLYLITDTGVKFPIPTAIAATTLGYGNVAPTGLPTALLNLLPTGPALDTAVAAHTAG